jgi:hypothetical protein
LRIIAALKIGFLRAEIGVSTFAIQHRKRALEDC